MLRFAVAFVTGVLSLAVAGAARADGGSVLFAADKAIWKTEGTGKGEPTKIVDLSADAGKVTRIEAQDKGRYLLLEIDGVIAYADVERSPGKPVPLDCASHARLSPDGGCIGCIDGKGRLVIHVLETGKKRVLEKVKPTDFGFASRTRLAVARTRSISFVSVAKGKQLEKVASFAPDSSLLVSPSGDRAVAAFENGNGKVLYGFKLDGKAARRKLTAGTPTRWSRDSKWIIAQSGDRTCVVRAVGGEYKCWNGYIGIALSPDDSEFLLAQKNSGGNYTLFKAAMAGARPETPKQWRQAESPAASWLAGE